MIPLIIFSIIFVLIMVNLLIYFLHNKNISDMKKEFILLFKIINSQILSNKIDNPEKTLLQKGFSYLFFTQLKIVNDFIKLEGEMEKKSISIPISTQIDDIIVKSKENEKKELFEQVLSDKEYMYFRNDLIKFVQTISDEHCNGDNYFKYISDNLIKESNILESITYIGKDLGWGLEIQV